MPAIAKRRIKEVLPEITLDRIAPPYLDYAYFEGREDRPFRPHATGLDMVNAWWLIEASTLAYASEEFAGKRFQSAGLGEVRFFDGPDTDTQCYVSSNEEIVIVAFRGTEIRIREPENDYRNIIKDIWTDARCRTIASGRGSMVHKGFKLALDEVWEGLREYVSGKDDGARTIWFTGHSLGAALATLAADRYGKADGLYTFGSPRVGDEDFKNEFHINAYRFVNNNDVVTRVPPPGPYRHVGELKYIDRYGRVHDDAEPRRQAADGGTGDEPCIFNASGQIRRGFGKLIPDSIVDHVPLLYATHIWNNIP